MTDDIVAKIKAYLTYEGVAPEIVDSLNNLLALRQQRIARPNEKSRGAFSPAAMLLRGALMAYLLPRLKESSRDRGTALINQAAKGITSKNYRARGQNIVRTLKDGTKGHLDDSAALDDLPSLLTFLRPAIEDADQITLTVVDKPTE